MTRLLHATACGSTQLGVGQGPLAEDAVARGVAALCAHWHVFRGTPVRYWLEAELAEIFGVAARPSARDRRRDLRRARRAARPSTPSGPRALLRAVPDRGPRHHRRPVRRPRRARGARRRPDVVRPRRSRPSGPTATSSRRSPAGPSRGPARRGGGRRHRRLRRVRRRAGGAAPALRRPRRDVGRPQPRGRPDRPARARRGRRASTAPRCAGDGHAGRGGRRFRRHMLLEMARMSCEDGLVMTLHPGVRRGHHGPTVEPLRARRRPRHPARASSSPTRCARCSSASARTRASTSSCSRSTRRCGRASSRRWPASTRRVYVGAPWWFLDAPEAIRRFRRAVTETAGFSRTSGFIDDTRAFCSIPARHDMSRRARRRRARRARRRAPARRGRGRSRRRSTWSPARPTRVFKL